jgi:bacteriocin biosynthesis cyclodehydratase domain-containing protein
MQTLVDIGIDQGLTADYLAKLKVGVVGTGELAASVSELLASAGFGNLSSFGSAPGGRASDIHALSKEAILEGARQVQLLIVAVDRAMLSSRHWANQAALETGCPALFVDVSAVEAVVGPTVLPGETGCYTCFRMRHLATSDAFAEVMAHEQHLDALRNPGLERPAFPGLRAMAAGAVVAEATRLLFAPLNPWLANAILRIDALTMKFERHEVLRQPDCPHCGGIDTAVRAGE